MLDAITKSCSSKYSEYGQIHIYIVYIVLVCLLFVLFCFRSSGLEISLPIDGYHFNITLIFRAAINKIVVQSWWSVTI